VERRIGPALAAGHWVLSDRYTGSTAAYQGYGRGLDLGLIAQLEQLATSGLEPDLTLWLDLPLADSLRRRGHRPADRIEAAGEAFLARVAAGFAALAEQRRWSRIDATAPAAAVTRACQQVLAQLGAVPGLPAGQPPGIVLLRGQASELELPGGLLGDG
jgi:dTMP kinase